MTKTFPPRVVIALLATSLVLVGFGADIWPAPSATAQAAAPYHWARKRSHFRLRVGNNVAGDWNRYLRAALNEWNQGETVTLVEVDGATNPQYCNPVSGTVQVCDWWYGTQTGWLGLTRLYFNARGDHIDAATIQLNSSFLYAPNSPYNNDAARRHTLCHELGHTLGLDHPETTSCMNNSQYAVFNYVTPINGDFRELRRVYEHQDATKTVARASEADLDLFGPTSWPQPDSEEDVMALPLDDETAVLTFVIWADETVVVAGTSVDVLNGDLGLEPAIADSDADGVADADERNLYRTDPMRADSDGDGALDGEELFGRGTDPLLWNDGSTATIAETDTETGAPASQPAPEVGATSTDLDADNYPDTLEPALGLDPRNPDTDGDAVADGDELNLYGTDPLNGDTDGDGVSDGEELFGAGTDPLSGDSIGGEDLLP
ncbi:MAG: hypothetical protein H0V00_18760 [Chloroflexia bacterium]|nr:hypothetical protein [Chloroflexia bacterium]